MKPNYYKLILLSLSTIFSTIIFGQQIQFSKSYFNSGDHQMYRFVELPDSGFILVGYTSNIFNTSDNKIFLMRLNKYGDTIFTKNYNFLVGEFRGVCLLNDSVVITTNGFWQLYSHGINTMKVNSNTGDTIEYRYYYNVPPAYSLRIQKCYDNGFILENSSAGSYNILKLDSNGNEQWHQWNNFTDGSSAVKPDQFGGYIAIGGNSGSSKPYNVLRLDNYGGILWQKSYGNNPGNVYGWITRDVIESADTNYIVACEGGDYYLMKINRINGDTLWTKPCCNGMWYGISSIVQGNSNFEYIAAANSRILFLDQNGDTIFTRPVPFQDLLPYQISKTRDGGFAYVGTFTTQFMVNQLFAFVKLDSLGNTVFTSHFNPETSNPITFYPNPATTELNIATNQFASETNCSITLTNIQGKIVLQQQYDKNQPINITILPNGIYIAELRGKEKVIRDKIIILH